MTDISRAIRLAVALLTVALGFLLVPRTASAQHETAADLLDGERAFRNSCANCHGPDGDVIAGIDLGRGQFRRPMTDDDLVRIIRTGIPNTPMPASPMTVEQAQKIVAYLRSRGRRRRAPASSPAMRRAARPRSTQGRLHVVPPRRRTRARASAPTSPTSAARRSAVELERALLDPGADVAAGQPHLPRRAEGRHDGDRPAARPRHLHRAAARHAGAAAIVRQERPARARASCRRRCRRTAGR